MPLLLLFWLRHCSPIFKSQQQRHIDCKSGYSLQQLTITLLELKKQVRQSQGKFFNSEDFLDHLQVQLLPSFAHCAGYVALGGTCLNSSLSYRKTLCDKLTLGLPNSSFFIFKIPAEDTVSKKVAAIKQVPLVNFVYFSRLKQCFSVGC